MKSGARGAATSGPEVTNISPHGFWILMDGGEMYLPFSRFPWFLEATIAQISEVRRLSPDHLHWPGLDVDLTVRSIEHPEGYPLRSRARPSRCSSGPSAVRSPCASPSAPRARRGQVPRKRR